MKDTDLAYCAELVRRDGDNRLQGFFCVEQRRLYDELMNAARCVREHGGPSYRFPISQTLEVDRGRGVLEYPLL